ncbi:MAG: hypothetical protein R3183_14325 [Oleiphilaceae bacterium]|nr:hypothetical protein [Oleiphilaceae bacterium]
MKKLILVFLITCLSNLALAEVVNVHFTAKAPDNGFGLPQMEGSTLRVEDGVLHGTLSIDMALVIPPTAPWFDGTYNYRAVSSDFVQGYADVRYEDAQTPFDRYLVKDASNDKLEVRDSLTLMPYGRRYSMSMTLVAEFEGHTDFIQEGTFNPNFSVDQSGLTENAEVRIYYTPTQHTYQVSGEVFKGASKEEIPLVDMKLELYSVTVETLSQGSNGVVQQCEL